MKPSVSSLDGFPFDKFHKSTRFQMIRPSSHFRTPPNSSSNFFTHPSIQHLQLQRHGVASEPLCFVGASCFPSRSLSNMDLDKGLIMLQ